MVSREDEPGDAKPEGSKSQPGQRKGKQALLFGLGFDNKDGQRRVTVGKNFLLAGGSKPTHELMQEKAIKFNEELDRRKKRIEDVTSEELRDIADQIGMEEQP